MYCSWRRLLQRGLKFHVCTINKSAHTKKKSGNLFNDPGIIKTDFPETWKLSTIIPIPKPGKDTSNPGNYRPISLMNCPCKTLKRMVNHRLVWYLKTNNLIRKAQCGYQKNCGCIDHLTNLESYIREAFIRGEHVITVFFVRKSLRNHLEIWNYKRSSWLWTKRQITWIH